MGSFFFYVNEGNSIRNLRTGPFQEYNFYEGEKYFVIFRFFYVNQGYKYNLSLAHLQVL